jgi:hypothetical protein
MSFIILFEEFRRTTLPSSIRNSKDAATVAGFALERELIDDLRKELAAVLATNPKGNFWSIKDPKVEYQATWLQNYIKNNRTGKYAKEIAQLEKTATVSSFMLVKEDQKLANPKLIASVLKEFERFPHFSSAMRGEFGAEFGDIIFSKNVRNHSPNYTDVKIFLDTKNTVKKENETLIAVRSLIRFGNKSTDNQPKLYLVKGPGYIYVFFFNKSILSELRNQMEKEFPPGTDLDKILEAWYNKKLYGDYKSTPDRFKLDKFDFMRGITVGVKVSYLLELLGSHKKFANLTEASKYILNLLNYLEKKK